MPCSPNPQQLPSFNAERRVGYRLRVRGDHGDPLPAGTSPQPSAGHCTFRSQTNENLYGGDFPTSVYQISCRMSQCVGRTLPARLLQHQPYQFRHWCCRKASSRPTFIACALRRSLPGGRGRKQRAPFPLPSAGGRRQTARAAAPRVELRMVTASGTLLAPNQEPG